MFSGEISAVRCYRLCPRGLRNTAPTPADIRALTLLAREQERLPAERITAGFDGSS